MLNHLGISAVNYSIYILFRFYNFILREGYSDQATLLFLPLRAFNPFIPQHPLKGTIISPHF